MADYPQPIYSVANFLNTEYQKDNFNRNNTNTADSFYSPSTCSSLLINSEVNFKKNSTYFIPTTTVIDSKNFVQFAYTPASSSTSTATNNLDNNQQLINNYIFNPNNNNKNVIYATINSSPIISPLPSLPATTVLSRKRKLSPKSTSSEEENIQKNSLSVGKRRIFKNENITPQCVICEDFASGRHYGVFACEGCKGFFRRTIIQIKNEVKVGNYPTYMGYIDIYRCIRSGTNDPNQRCEILVYSNRRRCCKSCRFKKCLDAGMKYEPSIAEPKNDCDKILDIFFLPETIDFQLQLYKSYESNICFLIKPFNEFINRVGKIEDIIQSNNIGQTLIVIIFDFLNIFTDDMMRKFLSNVKEFRKISISMQTTIILNSKYLLTCIILAFIYKNIYQQIQINSIIFGDVEFHNNFLQLFDLLKILAVTDEHFNLKLEPENEIKEEGIDIDLDEDDNYDNDKDEFKEEVKEIKEEVEDDEDEEVKSNIPADENELDLNEIENLFTKIIKDEVDDIFDEEEKMKVNEIKNELENIKCEPVEPVPVKNNYHMKEEEPVPVLNDSTKLFNHLYNAYLNSHALYDPNNVNWQQFLKTDKVKTTEENGIKVLMKIDEDDNKSSLLKLKEKYRYLPIFIAYIMLHNCNEKAAIEARNIIFNILINEFNLFDRFTPNQITQTMMINDDLTILFNNPNMNNNENINYINRFATSKMNKCLEKLSQILSRLLAIIRLKYSILP